MKSMPVRPLDVEVLLDEVGTFAVDVFRKLDGLFFAFSLRAQTADSLLKRRVNEDVEHIVTCAEVISGSASDDDTISFGRNLGQDLLYDLADAVGIHHVQTFR